MALYWQAKSGKNLLSLVKYSEIFSVKDAADISVCQNVFSNML